MKYTKEETARFKGNRKAASKREKEIRKGNYQLLNNGQYQHTITRKIYNFFTGNRTMVATK